MTQLSLLKIKLKEEAQVTLRNPDRIQTVGFDEQDFKYGLRLATDAHPLLPITEWVCHHLCLKCGIPCPDFQVVTRKHSDERTFGSKWELNCDQFIMDEVTEQQAALWMMDTLNDVAAIYALDCFLPNDDRHMGNFLFRRSPSRRAVAFDWDHVRLFDPWPLMNGSNTLQMLDWLAKSGLLVLPRWHRTLDLLSSITDNELRTMLDSAPDSWCSVSEKDRLQAWWKSHSAARILALR